MPSLPSPSPLLLLLSSLLLSIHGQGPCFRNASFTVNSRACEDMADISICASTFPITDARPSEKCFQQAYGDFAALCRKTCFSCCTDPHYNCPDRKDSPFSCSEKYKTCNEWKDVMTHFCPGTCGFCKQTSCRDKRMDCAQFKGLCADASFITLMKDECPLSCGFCDHEFDNNHTGNLGGGGGGGGKGGNNSNCVDSDSRCVFWAKNGVCNNPRYTAICAKSCGDC